MKYIKRLKASMDATSHLIICEHKLCIAQQETLKVVCESDFYYRIHCYFYIHGIEQIFIALQ